MENKKIIFKIIVKSSVAVLFAIGLIKIIATIM